MMASLFSFLVVLCLVGQSLSKIRRRLGSVAICICGRARTQINGPLLKPQGRWNQFREVDAVHLIERFLRKPLRADLYFALTFLPGDQLSPAFWHYLQTSPHVRSVSLDNITRSPWQKLRRGHLSNQSMLPWLAYGMTGESAKTLLYLRQWRRCMTHVRDTEGIYGYAYGYVAFTRIDYIWFAGHPSLSVLAATRCAVRATVWGIDHHEYSGIADRYLISERAGADVVADVATKLETFDGLSTVLQYVQSRSPRAVSMFNYERLLLHILQHGNLCLRLITPVAHNIGCTDTLMLGGCIALYPPFQASLEFASLWHRNATWEPTPDQPYLHGGWCNHIHESCCEPRAVEFGGDLNCWYALRRIPGGSCRPHFAGGLPKEPSGGWGAVPPALSTATPCNVISLKRCCQRKHVAVVLRPPVNILPLLQPTLPASVAGVRPWRDIGDSFFCIPSAQANAKQEEDASLAGIGALLCYDIDRLRSVALTQVRSLSLS